MHTIFWIIAAVIITAVFFVSPFGRALTKETDAEAEALKESAEKSIKDAANDVANHI